MNWELPDWPNFRWEHEKFARSEKLFLENAGVMIGASQHISNDDVQTVIFNLAFSAASLKSRDYKEFRVLF